MELLEIISTVHSLSQKGSEFNEEIQTLNFTVKALGLALRNFDEQTAPEDWDMFLETLKELL
jgi:hypothetical protein